jgi:hypothetical protein
LLHPEGEEASTAPLQVLDEEEKQLLQPFQYPDDDLGFIEEELKRLLKVANALGLIEQPDEISSKIKHCMKDRPLSLKPSEVEPYSPTQLLQLFATIIRRMLMKLSALPPVTMPTPEVPDHYPHTSVPEHALWLVEEGKAQTPKKGTIFERSDAKLFFEALEDPDHKYKHEAEAAIQGFTKAVEKSKVTSLNRAAKTYGIPMKNLSEWVAKGLIPHEYRDKNAIYVTTETLEKVAPVYYETREQGQLTAPLLRKMHDELFPPSSKSPQK